MISPIFTTIVLISAFIWIYMKVTVKKVDKGTENFLEKEHQSNLTRKQSLATLDYIYFTKDSIPFTDTPNANIKSLQNTLIELTSQNIVNLTGITNTDLKLQYGAANLPILTEYDKNYSLLTKSLYDLGLLLVTDDYRADAYAVLEYAISIGTDLSANYLTLANMYIEDERYDEISKLISSADNIHSLSKNSIISKLSEMMANHKTVVIPVQECIIASETEPAIEEPEESIPATDNVVTPSPSTASNNNDNIPFYTKQRTSTDDKSSIDVDPSSILPKDILDILETAPYISDDQK